MPSLIKDIGVEDTSKMRYAKLPDIFEDSTQVGSDWYTLAAITPESIVAETV